MLNFNISQNGLDFIAKHEGCKLLPYDDVVGYATVGVGHLIGKRPVNESDRQTYKNFTQQDAFNLLNEDMKEYVKCVNTVITNPKITQNQFDAMVSLCYNIGCGNFSKSSVVKKTNLSDYVGAAGSFLLWNKAGGKVIQGLTTRRQNESNLYLRK